MFKKIARCVYRALEPKIKQVEQVADKSAEIATEPIQIFKYQKPSAAEKGSKEIVLLCKNNHLRGAIHVIRKGSEEHLHSHNSIDGFWMVLRGKARFHGEENIVFGDFDPMEEILVPRGIRYWFESMGEQDLELLQVLSIDAVGGWHRQNFAPGNFDKRTMRSFDARGDTNNNQDM